MQKSNVNEVTCMARKTQNIQICFIFTIDLTRLSKSRGLVKRRVCKLSVKLNASNLQSSVCKVSSRGKQINKIDQP